MVFNTYIQLYRGNIVFIKATSTRIGIFLNSQIFLCGFKNFHLHGQRIDNKFAQFLADLLTFQSRLMVSPKIFQINKEPRAYPKVLPSRNSF